MNKTIEDIKEWLEKESYPTQSEGRLVPIECSKAAIDEAVRPVEDKWTTGMRNMTCAVLFEYGDCPSTCDPLNKDDWCQELHERVKREFKELDEKWGTTYLGMEVEE